MDWNDPAGQKLAGRLRAEQVVWLTTVRPNGTPLPTPVWFLWEGETFLIYTLRDSLKLKNIAQNTRVALNLNSNAEGGDVAVFTGVISVEENEPPAKQNPSYLEKYRQGIQDIGMNPESFSAAYSVALRFHPRHVRAE